MNVQPIIEHEAPRTPAPFSAITPMAMLDRAVEQGAGIEVLTKLMELQERWERNQARKAFDAATAAAKAEIAIVGKNKTGHNNKRYADFAAYAAIVDPVISKHGLAYRFRTQQDERLIHVTCVLFGHGHAEENTLVGPADATGNKNAIQAIGSTLTYLQRYSLVQALGLAASEDDDGRSAGGTITEEQVTSLRSLIVETATDIPKVLSFAKVERLEDIPITAVDLVMSVIRQRAAKATVEGETRLRAKAAAAEAEPAS